MVLELKTAEVPRVSKSVPIIDKASNAFGRTIYRANHQEGVEQWVKRLDDIQVRALLLRDLHLGFVPDINQGETSNFTKLGQIQEAVVNNNYQPNELPRGEVLGAHPYMPGEVLIDYVAGSENHRKVASSIAKGKRNYLSRLKRKGLDIVLRRSMNATSMLDGVGIAASNSVA
jgi:hypothetical protein